MTATREQAGYLEEQANELVAEALLIVRSRDIYAVSRSSEEKVIAHARTHSDLAALQAIIDYGQTYQAGCIHRASSALRKASGGSGYRIELEHVQAASEMIDAIISVIREDLSPANAIRQKAYEEIAEYGVIHHIESHRIATIVRERKVTSLRELLVVLNGMRELEAGVLGEGFI